MEQKHYSKVNLILLVCFSLCSLGLIQKTKAAAVKYGYGGGEVKFTNVVYGSKLFDVDKVRTWAHSGTDTYGARITPCTGPSYSEYVRRSGQQDPDVGCLVQDGKSYKDIMIATNVTGVEWLRRYRFDFKDPYLSSNYYKGYPETSTEKVFYMFLYMDPLNIGKSKKAQSGWCNGFIKVKKIIQGYSTDKDSKGRPTLDVYVERKVFPVLADLSKRKAADSNYAFPCPKVGTPIQIISIDPSSYRYPNFKGSWAANLYVKINIYSADKIPTTTPTTVKGVLAE